MFDKVAYAKQYYDAKVASIPKWRQALTRPEVWAQWMAELRAEANTAAENMSKQVDREQTQYVDNAQNQSIGQIQNANLSNVAKQTTNAEVAFANPVDESNWLKLQSQSGRQQVRKSLDDVIQNRIGGYTAETDTSKLGDSLAQARVSQLQNQMRSQSSGYRYDPSKVKQSTPIARPVSGGSYGVSRPSYR